GRNNQLTEAEVERELELLSGYDIWQDMDRYMYRTGLDQQYRVELSGGGVSNDYLMSYGMDRNRSTQVAENLGRHTVNIRNGYRFAGDRLTLTSALLFSSLSGTSNTRR